jgi:glutamine synthetase
MWSDLNGLAHGRYIPERRVNDHTHHAVTTLTMSINGEILPVEGYGADVGFPDLSAVPLVATRRPGWEPDTDVMVADLEFEHHDLALSPRGALKRAVTAWHELGYEPMLGFELEFYVLAQDPDAPGGAAPLRLRAPRVYGTGLGGIDPSLMFALFDAAEDSQLDVEGMMAEFSPGQVEMNLRYGPALDAADRAFLAKDLTREVAASRGAWVTYIGRPFADAVGSGLHINMSLRPLDVDVNAFADPQGEHGLSRLARQCLGGLIAHHEALAAPSAPLVNSYKRLMPGLIAGYWANWGLDNRISTYRIPGERGAATRIENRMPCGSANPYLAAAAQLHAARLGVLADLDCGDPQVGDGDTEPNTDRHTPHTLGEALAALTADSALCEALGADLIRAYTTIRRDELARFEASGTGWSVEEISPWELAEFLPYH